MSEPKLEPLYELVQDLKAGVSLSRAWSKRESMLELEEPLKHRVTKLVNLCRSLGTSPVVALERLLSVARQSEEFNAELQAEWATPRATMRLVVWLPVGFIALAQLLGLPIFQAVSENLLAKVAVILGVLLLLFARYWSAKILAKAKPVETPHAEQIDLVAVALGAGLTFDKALDKVSAVSRVGELLVQERLLARTTGAPIAALALNRAERLRVLTQRQNRLRIREAAVTLMWPLGVAVLPSLILLLVVPLSVGFASPVAQ